MDQFHATTILSVRRPGHVVVGGDGQVSMGNTILKGNARKVRRIGDGNKVSVRFRTTESVEKAELGGPYEGRQTARLQGSWQPEAVALAPGRSCEAGPITQRRITLWPTSGATLMERPFSIASR